MILADILCIFHTTGQTCAFSNSLQKRTKSCSGYSLMILIKGCKWPWSAWHSDTVNHSGGIVAHSGIVAYCTDFPHLAAGLGANAHLYSTIIYSYHRCLHVWVLSTLFSIYSWCCPPTYFTLYSSAFIFSLASMLKLIYWLQILSWLYLSFPPVSTAPHLDAFHIRRWCWAEDLKVAAEKWHNRAKCLKHLPWS